MMTNRQQYNRDESGFALLLTLLVVTVLISIGLSVLNLSIQQVRLASTARDSEIAFQAANAGLECAHYWRREEAAAMEAGDDNIPIGCFGVTQNIDADTVSGVSGGDAYQYEYEFTWGATNDRCTIINTVIGVADLSGSGLTINNMPSLVPGYPDGNTKNCAAGTLCSVISVEGYNRPCTDITSFGTVQREVLLQL
jgi:Tfp pilus assembly protein PilV